MYNNGIFTISLDFELHWGVSHRLTQNEYFDNLSGVREAITGMLYLFEKYDIHVTWATVGFLFGQDKDELSKFLPELKPCYENKKYDNYTLLRKIGNNEIDSPFHYAKTVIKNISTYNHQEIASHTFSHLFCLEDGITLAAFEDDLKSMIKIAEANGFIIESLVFPRNQYDETHLQICKNHNILSRVQPNTFFDAPVKSKKSNLIMRAFRYFDNYIIFFPSKSHNLKKVFKDVIEKNVIPSSLFFRPFNIKFPFLNNCQKYRIRQQMLKSAKEKRLFHLWWHPHNFGKNIFENLNMLEDILKYYKELSITYGFKSMNMKEIKDYAYHINDCN
jgi:hypothetical protein